MRVTSRSEDEAKRVSKRKVLKPGWYPAEFKEVTEKVSKNDNEMLECGLLVTDTNGDQFPVTDWLVEAAGGAGAAKLRSAVVAVDALERYEAGKSGLRTSSAAASRSKSLSSNGEAFVTWPWKLTARPLPPRRSSICTRRGS